MQLLKEQGSYGLDTYSTWHRSLVYIPVSEPLLYLMIG